MSLHTMSSTGRPQACCRRPLLPRTRPGQTAFVAVTRSDLFVRWKPCVERSGGRFSRRFERPGHPDQVVGGYCKGKLERDASRAAQLCLAEACDVVGSRQAVHYSKSTNFPNTLRAAAIPLVEMFAIAWVSARPAGGSNSTSTTPRSAQFQFPHRADRLNQARSIGWYSSTLPTSSPYPARLPILAHPFSQPNFLEIISKHAPLLAVDVS